MGTRSCKYGAEMVKLRLTIGRRFLCVCPLIDDKMLHNIVKVAVVGFSILGFHVTSQALLKSVSAMLVSLGCQIYANNRPFLQ